MSNDKDLLYTPDIKHSESYYTEGQVNRDNEVTGPQKVIITKPEKIKKLYEDIKLKALFLPDEIINTYLSPLIAMKDEFENILKDLEKEEKDDDKKDKDKEVVPPIVPPVEPEVSVKDPDDIFDKDDDIYIDIIDPEGDFEVNIEEGYNSNFTEIYEDYLIKVGSELDKFVYEILEVNSNEKINFEIAEISSSEIKNTNLLHLSDYIVKSNIYIQQGMRLHKKIFNIDESIFHIKAPKVAKEQMLRYYKADYYPPTSELNIKNNGLLKESRYIAEKKYNDNTRDLYKYLNSQVMFLRDTLNSVTKQMSSMAMLSKENEGEK